MELEVNGEVTRDAGQSDLARAFTSRPTKGEWSITLESADGSYLQAFAEEGRNYRLTTRSVDDVQTDSRDQLDAQAANKVLSQYLSGDPAWRDAMDWKAAPTNKVTETLREIFTDPSHGPEIQTEPPNPPDPPGSGASAAGGLLILVLGGLLIYGAFTRGPATVAKYFPKVDDPRLPTLVGCMGLFALLFGIWTLVTAIRARSWPSIQAEVTVSKVIEESSSIGTGGNRTNRRLYAPRVEYRYTVDGQTYTSKQISLGLSYSSGETWAQQVVARYPVGSPVVAYYDPSSPRHAFLEYSMMAPLLGFGLAVAFLGFFGHLVGLY